MTAFTSSGGLVRIGIVGKPNVGKSTFFAAATLADVDIANYPFCTIEANVGVAFLPAPTPCPCAEIRAQRESEGRLEPVTDDDPRGGSLCIPNTGSCTGHIRLVPTFLVDVAGLVPGAHEGRGRGNAFLSDLASCDALIQVIDAAGTTDVEGNPIGVGEDEEEVAQKMLEEYDFLTTEIAAWIQGIIEEGWQRGVRRVQAEGDKGLGEYLHERLTGIGSTPTKISRAIEGFKAKNNHERPPWEWDDTLKRELARHLRSAIFPIHIAANKAEIAPGRTWLKLADKISADGGLLTPCFADGELALNKARKAGLLQYSPGDADFSIAEDAQLSPPQQTGLDHLRGKLQKLGGTGVASLISQVLYSAMDHIVAYPVQDESSWADGEGKVLPDALVVPNNTTAKELAYAVHTDLADGFIKAVDCRSKRVIGADHELSDGDVVKIHAKS
ncbi:MAG: YchF-related putative GTPase [Pseudomonadales bacterium]|nr:YchF-related putative GTPase [Pseudomonadales bacterium]